MAWFHKVYSTPVKDVPNFHLMIVNLEMLNVILALIKK